MSSLSRTGSTSVTPAAIASRLRWLSIAAFAVTRGAGGVREQGHVVRPAALEQRVVAPRLARVELAALASTSSRLDEHGLPVVLEPAHVVHDDPLEPRQRGADAEDLVGLLLVLDQDEARLAVLEDVAHLVGQAVDVDPERDRARATGRPAPT